MFAAEKCDLVHILVMPRNQSFPYNVFTLIECSFHDLLTLLPFLQDSARSFYPTIAPVIREAATTCPSAGQPAACPTRRSVICVLRAHVPPVKPEQF